MHKVICSKVQCRSEPLDNYHSLAEATTSGGEAQFLTVTYMNHAHAAVDWKCLSNLLIITSKRTAAFFIAQFRNSNNFTWLITGTKVLS